MYADERSNYVDILYAENWKNYVKNHVNKWTTNDPDFCDFKKLITF